MDLFILGISYQEKKMGREAGEDGEKEERNKHDTSNGLQFELFHQEVQDLKDTLEK